MREIAAAIQQGAQAYLNRQYTTIAIVGVVLFLVIGFALHWTTAVGFAVGAVLSGLAGLHRHERVGARQRAHRRSRAHRPERSAGDRVSAAAPSPACWWSAWVCSAWRASSGYCRQPGPGSHASEDRASAGRPGLRRLADFDLSRGWAAASSPRAPTSAPTWSAKSKPAFPKTIRAIPAVIADNVGDNVGDCAGMAADLFETYAVTIIATMLLGALLIPSRIIALNAVVLSAGAGRRVDHRLHHRLLFRQSGARRQRS